MTKRLFLLPLCTALACDDPDLEGTPDRGDDDPDPIEFRPLGSGTLGGSTRLNTAKLFLEGMPVRHFARAGGPVTYDNPAATTVTFVGLRILGAGGGEFSAAGNVIRSDLGTVSVNGTAYSAGQLLGSEWRFTVGDSTRPARPVTLRITGVGLYVLPGGSGDLPLYNFTLTSSLAFYENGPYSACAAVDILTETSMTIKTVNDTPIGVPNNFKKTYAAVLYGGVQISELGTVAADKTMVTLACVSGAVGKAGLWGYPPWVSPFGGLGGVQQLQAATRAVRADFCADGTSHTADGTPLQVRDRWWNSFDDPTEPNESVWGGNGSTCRVEFDRLASGATFGCSGLTTSCNQSASDWITGPDAFMWTKVDQAMHPITPKTPCNTTAGTPGCADPGIQARVCAVDPFCCNNHWDPTCVNEVVSLGAAASACCVDNGGPGCGDAAVSACVGGYDSYCTTGRWDSMCALEVEHLGCGLCR